MNEARVIERAAVLFSLRPDEIANAAVFRARAIARARSAVVYVLRSQGAKWKEIGQALGYSDHTGAIALYEKAQEIISEDRYFAHSVRLLKEAA